MASSPESNSVLAAGIGAALATTLLAACGPSAQQGGGFPPAPVSVETAQALTVPVHFEFVGQTEGSKEAQVRARVQGILEKRLYQEGGRVTAGQPLFLIDPKPYAAQAQAAEADLARAQAQYAQAHRNFERVQPLKGSNALSQREYDEAVSGEETGAAAVKQAQARLTEARLNLGYTNVTAPVSGFASKARQSEGSLVTPTQDSLLTTVSQIDPIYVNFSVSEAEQLRLNRLVAAGTLKAPAADRSGTPAYEVTVKLSDGTVYARKGRLAFIDPRINTATGAFDARAELPNPDATLRPGQFVRVVLEGATRANTIVVPQRAVMDGPQGKFVYVAAKSQDGKMDVAQPRPVTVGDWVELGGQQLWVVESGLKPGDPVIVEGQAKLFPIPGGAPIALGPTPGAPGAGPGEAKKPEAKK
ncbi:MAG TPA: efflux RND transporter periplasmic adaptor subunit [Burkholderiaceae bacterium]|nr:efflux RND transporter periplasmic adaptor subunit [Burkholderiaceae bacterium]